MYCTPCQTFFDEIISKAQVPELIEKCADIRWASHESTIYTSLRDLKRAADLHCRTCRIIYSSPTQYEHASLLNDHDEAIDIVLSIDPGNDPYPTISAEFREGAKQRLRLPKRLVASCTGLCNDEELATTLDRCVTLENDHTGSDGALQLAQFWTKRCLDSHDKCSPMKSLDTTSFVPTRLLDVSNDRIRLVESEHDIAQGADRSFVALSHCWGLVPIIRTLKKNYNDHREHIAATELSKTFRDAVHATRNLGFRYLWIDSLCIIQDDGEDWAKEAKTMCDVYQCAVLTIAAAHAPGGDVGCFAERDGLLQLPLFIELPGPKHGSSPVRVQFMSYGRISDVGGGEPALYGRAWVLQEQLLSPRMLIFDGIQLRWQCLTMHGSEGSPLAGIARHDAHYKFIRSGIMDDVEYFEPPKDDSSQDHVFWSRLKHQYWCEIVMDFTHRGMTKSHDRLVALAGIGMALNRHTKSQYLAGLWSEHFTVGLLWSIAHNEKWQLSVSKGFDLEGNKKVRHGEEVAPSWSWASVTVPIMYAQTEVINYDRICEVVNVDVTGGVVTIRGHVRRGYVNPIYPYAIREAADAYPHMTAPLPTGRKGLEYSTFRSRLFHPIDYFLFSATNPAAKLKDTTPHNLSKSGSFRMMRGAFRPDEIIDPGTELTFIAIAQHHFGSQLTSHMPVHTEDSALKVHSLALVPTGNKPREYRRVGLAIWEQCAWYGYLCGWKDERDRRVYRPGNFSDDGYLQDDTWWDWLARKVWWDDLEAFDECGVGKHGHAYVVDDVPDLAKYHPDVRVEETTVTIV